MVAWAEFAESSPELASLGRERLERFGFVFVATVRRDGGPRVNPVEAYIVQGHLAVNMMWRSLKALDLLRDPRLFVHTPIVDRLGSPGEFKLRGRAIQVDDRSLRGAIVAAFEAAIEWTPPERSHFFTVDIESAAFVTYESDGTQRVKRWHAARGVD